MTRFSMRSALVPVALATAFGGGMVASRASADQPYMHQALDQLLVARATLARGSEDKGGHRVRALAAVDGAIREVRAGIGFDRAH